ncbi:hypothetical protein FSP39_021360 [Pinctada imbricata]|uniref:Transmembrane protein 19 n=1 Tax=Pinctada imbricata TaxID=66713 RepID=A0AA88YN63_PINIB|nr:hypothetical protein FSP39_021360 [Pinctada imbricata]
MCRQLPDKDNFMVYCLFSSGGQKNWIQVLCNGGVAAQFALFYMIDTGCLERPIDFTHNYSASWYATAEVGALVCSCGDTYASEIGTLVERNTQPGLITTFSVVPKVTNGAITLMGTLCSAIGGLFIGLAYYTSQLFICTNGAITLVGALCSAIGGLFIGLTYYTSQLFICNDSQIICSSFLLLRFTGTNGAKTLVGTLCSAIGGLFIGLTYYTSQLFICNDSQIISTSPQWPMILYGVICGLLGSSIDSILGALFQYSGFDRESGKIVEKSGKDVEHIVGIQLFDNHSVNLISSLLCAVLMPTIAFSLWRYFV